MNNISNKVISIEEARAALRNMRLSGLSETEALETVDELALRIRTLTDAKLVEHLIETELPENQANIIRHYWYLGQNTMQIAREFDTSQSHIYRTLTRANNTIKKLMSPVIQYHNDIISAEIVPLHFCDVMDTLSAQKQRTESFHGALRNLRVSYAITPEQLARNLKISLKELADIESGRKIPTTVTASRYTALFDATITMDFHNGRGNYECRIQH